RRAPGLGLVLGYVDLDEDANDTAELRRAFAELGGDVRRVDRVNRADHGSDEPRLVGLQVSDHVPLDVGEVGGFARFGDQLLRVVLSERAQAEAMRLAYGARWLSFGNGDDPDALRIALGRSGSSLHALAHRHDPSLDIAHRASPSRSCSTLFGG